METLEGLRRRIESAEDLLSVVKTMKTLAAANINQFERAVASLEDYYLTLQRAFQVALRHQPPSASLEGTGTDSPDTQSGPQLSNPEWGVVVFGSDQGLCGQFNERIAEYALNTLNGMHIRHCDRRMIAIGRRVAERLLRAGQELEATYPVPGSVEGIVPTVQELLVRVAAWQSEQGIGHTTLFYNRATSRIAYESQMTQLFPVDPNWLEQVQSTPWPSRRMPVIFMDWEELFRRLNRQYFFVTLYRATAQSLASEHAARLASMQAAEQNIDEHLGEFNRAYQQQRQKVITDELLDIVSGFEALSS